MQISFIFICKYDPVKSNFTVIFSESVYPFFSTVLLQTLR